MATATTEAPVEIGVIPSFEVTIRVRRFNPEVSEDVTWQDFQVTMFGTDLCSTRCTRLNGNTTAR